MRSNKSDSDASLWERAVAGETECFGTLFERHARRVYSHCWRRTADSHLAEDLMSVTFLEAWRRRDQVVLSQESALPWLLGVATNVCRNANRSKRRYQAALNKVPAPVAVDTVGDATAEGIDAEIEMRRVLKRMETLSAADQDIISLCVWQRLSYEEASIALGIPIGTVQSRLARARARLRDSQSSTEHALRSEHKQGEHAVVFRPVEEQ